MLLQAAVAVVLHKAGGGVDVPIGAPVAGRSEANLDQLIGFFINIVVLRNDLRGNPTLREVLQRTRQMALAAYAHQDLPFDQVVEAVNPSGRCPAIRCSTLLCTFANKCRKTTSSTPGPTVTPRCACWSRHSMPRKPIYRSTSSPAATSTAATSSTAPSCMSAPPHNASPTG